MEAPVAQTIHYFRDNGLFPSEDIHDVTLGELYCELLSIRSNDDPNITKFLQAQGVVYPHIVVPWVEKLQVKKETLEVNRSSSQNNFLKTFVKSIENYLSNVENDEFESAPQISSEAGTFDPKTSNTLLNKLWNWAGYQVQGLWRPQKILSEIICREASDPIRSFAWHKYKAKFSVALGDDSVRIYDMNAGAWSPVILRHEFQRNIFVTAWKPLSGNTLSVGALHGVLVWTIISKNMGSQGVMKPLAQILGSTSGATWNNLSLDHTNPKHQDVTAWCSYLHYPGHSPINALDWSPGGRYLAVGSIQSGQLIIWDFFTETPTPLVQYCPGNITQVLWSPNDDYVCVITSTNVFRVFQTRNWASEKWADLKGPVKSACWSGDGSHLAFTVTGEDKFYIIRYSFSGSTLRGSLISVVDMAPYNKNLQPHHKPSSHRQDASVHEDDAPSRSGTATPSADEENDDVTVGGALSFIAWDPSGSRLVVALEGSSLITVYQCNGLSYGVALQPLGFIRGPPDTVVTSLSFKPYFPRGALLTATFSNGKIAFYPLYFKPTAHLMSI